MIKGKQQVDIIEQQLNYQDIDAALRFAGDKQKAAKVQLTF